MAGSGDLAIRLAGTVAIAVVVWAIDAKLGAPVWACAVMAAVLAGAPWLP